MGGGYEVPQPTILNWRETGDRGQYLYVFRGRSSCIVCLSLRRLPIRVLIVRILIVIAVLLCVLFNTGNYETVSSGQAIGLVKSVFLQWCY